MRVANRANGAGWHACQSTGTQPGSRKRQTFPGDREGIACNLVQCRSELKGFWAGKKMGKERTPATCKDFGGGGRSVSKRHLF